VIQKIKSLFFLASVVFLISLLFCGQSYAQSNSKITPRLLELSRQKLKAASSAPAYGENSKVYVLFTASTNTDAVDFSFFNERKIEYIKSEHYIEAVIDAALIPELDSIAGIAEIDISIQAAPAASAGNAMMNVTDYNNNGIKGAGVKIGIVDIQYDGYQSRLPGSVITADFTKTGYPAIENSGTNGTHGTVCAGIVYDIVPEAQMYISRISSVVSMENAYAWCLLNGVKIISISLDMGSTQANTIVNNYTDKGILTVAAAGNSGPGANTIIIPATQERVLTAGSIDLNNAANWTNNTLWNGSSRGPGANGCIKPDIIAPSPGGYTSFAAPHAAGAAAILLSVAHSSLCDTPAKLKALVVSFARPIGTAPDNNYGYGKLVLPNYSDFGLLKTGTISTITPTESRRGTNNVSVTINGTNLVAGSTARLVRGSNTITANSVTFNSSNRLTATFNIPSGAAVGYYDLVLSSSGYTIDVRKDEIFLVFGSMSINNVTPDTGARGLTLNLTATGAGFQSGATIKLVSGGTVINGTGITQSGTTSITASFALPASITDGTKFDLTITNPNGDYETKTQAVTVYDTSAIDTITPAEGRIGTNNVSVTINGTNLLAGSTAKLIKGTSTITANSVTYNSSSRLTATFNIPATAAVGRYDLTVSSSGYASDLRKNEVFLVLGNSMAINNVTPDVTTRGNTAHKLTATGTDFQSGATIKLVVGSTVIAGTYITQSGTTAMTATFNIPFGLDTGTKLDLTITNPNGDYVTKTQAVTVYNSLSVSAFTPSSATVSSTVNITVNGSGFINGHSKIILRNVSDTSQMITASTTSVSATQIAGTFTAPSSTGTWKVYVLSYEGGYEYPAPLTMNIINSRVGTIDTITPSNSKVGTNNVSITVNGINLLAGSTVRLVRGGSTVTAHSVTYDSSSKLTATFNIPSSAVAGYYDVTVSSSGYNSDARKNEVFLIVGNSMAINNVAPDIGIIGTTLRLTVTGTDFQSGATIKLTRGTPAIIGTDITVNGTTSITASFVIPSMQNGLQNDLTITNPSGDYVTKTGAVTIYDALTVTSFTPSSAAAGSAVSLTVNGTGFKSGYSKIILKNASNESQTITPSTTSVSATRITATFTAPGSSGTWKVYVAAYNGGPEYAAPSNLSITGSAVTRTIDTITPTESKRGTNNVSVTINGTNFLSGSTAKLVKGTATITANSVTFNSSNRLTATFNIPSTAAVGYYDLAVSSSGYAGDITKAGIFLVLGNSMAINNVTPDIGIRGTTLRLTAAGTDFQSGAAIKLVNGSTVINGTSITQSGTTGITASFAIPSGVANNTKFDLTVTNTSGDYITKTQTVTAYSALTVTSFTPSNATAGSAVSLTVTGTGFINGYSKIILKNASNESQTIMPSTTSASATQIAGTFAAPSSAGTWKVYVSAYNGGPEYAASSNLNITALPAGTISTIMPAESRRGTNNVSITINGTNLVTGSTAKLIKGTATITANSVTYNSSSRLTATFNIPSAAAVGYYDLAVSSSGYASDITKTGIFLVLGNSMAINNVTPDIGIRGTTLRLTAAGTDFQSGAAIKLVNGSTVINGTGITQSGTTGITASFALPLTIANGTKFDLTVTNTSGDYITRTQAVTVYNALTVTSFTPLVTNAGSVLITVTGTGFINGYTKVVLKNAFNESVTITPSITSASAMQISGTFTATSSGTWKVYVRAYDNGPEYLATASMTILASTAHNLFAYERAEIEFTVISKDGAQSTGKMIIPERTFSEDVTVDVKQHGSLAPADSYVRELSHTNIGVHIDAQGKKAEREIELRIPYNNSDITGMNEDSLVISRYDEEKQVWIPLKSKADNANKQIIAYLDHLSVFAIMGTVSAVKAFDDIKYYPNPMQPSKGLNYSRMHFSNMPSGTRIKIYTMLGKAVRELEADASGMAVWDGQNNAGEKVASGVYIVYMEDRDGNKKRIKVAVER